MKGKMGGTFFDGKTISIFIGIAIVIASFYLTGQENVTGAVVGVEVECNEPYIRFGEGCCLDENSNGICDNDESQQVKEVEKIIVADKCSGNDYYDCVESNVYEDRVFFEFRASKGGYNHIKEVSLPESDCVEILEDKKIDEGVNRGEVIKVNVNCNTGGVLEDAPYEMKLVLYPKTEEINYEVEANRGYVLEKGVISGSVD